MLSKLLRLYPICWPDPQKPNKSTTNHPVYTVLVASVAVILWFDAHDIHPRVEWKNQYSFFFPCRYIMGNSFDLTY